MLRREPLPTILGPSAYLCNRRARNQWSGNIRSHDCKAHATHGFTLVAYDHLERGFHDAIPYDPFVEADLSDADALDRAVVTYAPAAAQTDELGIRVTDAWRWRIRNSP